MKKKKNKVRKIFKILGVLVILALFIIVFININLKNIYIKGNVILSDQEIIELAGIEKYPKIIKIPNSKIISKIKMSQVIEDVKVKKNLFGRIDIEIKEYNMLIKNEIDNKVYLSNGKKIDVDEFIPGLPTLINVVPEDILNVFLKKIDKVDKNILPKISEIEYKPNNYDKELFIFYMNDGNYVYINTSRLLNLDKYESMLEQLDGKKGIIYLDSGNHFEILN